MLIIHPSSRCDVCLDAYSWASAQQTPHAIPCGHIFCFPCLLALNPAICPLCRKAFLPNKAKKLHVDRPENVDDHREIDLLQRLAVNWEAPEDQLDDLMMEVDNWLKGRADDTCTALRKSRLALGRHLALKSAEADSKRVIEGLESSLQDLDRAIGAEQSKHGSIEAAQQQAIDNLGSENTRLKSHLEELQVHMKRLEAEVESAQHASRRSQIRNPLPAPPEPIPTNQVPTFAQAASESGFSRFSEYSASPLSSRSYPFEVESGRRRERERPRDGRRSHVSAERRPMTDEEVIVLPSSSSSARGRPLPSPHPAPPSLVNSTSSDRPVYPESFGNYGLSSDAVHPPSQVQLTAHQAPQGLQLHFEPRDQPLDVYSLTSAYIREYAAGMADGQRVAASGGPVANETSSIVDESRHTSSSDRRRRRDDPGEYRQTQHQLQQPSYLPALEDASIQPSVSSHASSLSHTRERSRGRASPSAPSIERQITNPALASILSPPQSQTSPPSVPNSAPLTSQQYSTQSPPHSNANSYSAQPLSAPPTHHTQLQPPTAAIAGHSPSTRSQRSHRTTRSNASNNSWGTVPSISSTFTTGSLIPGLRTFRSGVNSVWEGSEQGVLDPSLLDHVEDEGEHEIPAQQRPRNEEEGGRTPSSRRISLLSGASSRGAMSILETDEHLGGDGGMLSSSPDDMGVSNLNLTAHANSTQPPSSSQQSSEASRSPVRPVESMVGVLPTAASQQSRHPGPSAYDYIYRPTTAMDTRGATSMGSRPPHRPAQSWASNSGSLPSVDEFGASHSGGRGHGYQTDVESSSSQPHRRRRHHAEESRSAESQGQAHGYGHVSSSSMSMPSSGARDRADHHRSGRSDRERERRERHPERHREGERERPREREREPRTEAATERDRNASRRHRGVNIQPLPISESPFPISIEATESEEATGNVHSSSYSNPRPYPPAQPQPQGLAHPQAHPATQTFGNALGLELSTGPQPISAPTPVARGDGQSFLRSFNRDA